MIVVVVAVVVFKLVVVIVFIVVDIAKVTLPTSYQTVIVSPQPTLLNAETIQYTIQIILPAPTLVLTYAYQNKSLYQ